MRTLHYFVPRRRILSLIFCSWVRLEIELQPKQVELLRLVDETPMNEADLRAAGIGQAL